MPQSLQHTEHAMGKQDKENSREFFESLSPRQRAQWQREKAMREMMAPTFNRAIADRARRRMERVDELEPDVRAVVHDHGLEVVQILLDHRIRSAEKLRWLIDFVHNAETPRSMKSIRGVCSLGFTHQKAMFLIDTILGADYENGARRFKFNKGPNAKQNPISQDDDDEAYFVLGPVVTKS